MPSSVTPCSIYSVIEQCRLIELTECEKYLQILHTFTPLCNDIAHSAWIEVKPETSICPAWLSHELPTTIKAVHDIDELSQFFVEDDQDRATYTLDELKKDQGAKS